MISSRHSWGASVEYWGGFGIEATSEEGPGSGEGEPACSQPLTDGASGARSPVPRPLAPKLPAGASPMGRRQERLPRSTSLPRQEPRKHSKPFANLKLSEGCRSRDPLPGGQWGARGTDVLWEGAVTGTWGRGGGAVDKAGAGQRTPHGLAPPPGEAASEV